MKKINLSFVEFKIVKTSFEEENKLAKKLKKEHEIKKALNLSLYSEFNEVEQFEDTLKSITKDYKDFKFEYELEFDVVSDSVWIEYELPALFATNASLMEFPSQIIDSIKFSESVEFIWSFESISDVNEGILKLFPEKNDNFEKIILFNHLIYKDLFEGGCLTEGLHQAILERRHVGL